MDPDFLKDAHLSPFFIYVAFGISLVLAIFRWLNLYYGMRTQNFKLSSERTERLYKLASDGSWRQASPATLMMAYGDAFRRELDDRSIRFALGRHRPLPLLRDIQRCVGMVKISADGARFVHKAGLKLARFSYRRHSQVAFLAAFVPYVILAITGKFLIAATSPHTVGLIFGALLAWIPIMMSQAKAYETAHRLVEVLDDVYPVWNVGPDTAASDASVPMSASPDAEPASSAPLKSDQAAPAAS